MEAKTRHAPYVRCVAESKKAVLMIHGICSTPRHFDFLVSSLPKSVTVYALLLYGHGGTAREFGSASMKNWRKDVEEALCFLEKEHEEIIIAGYSMGTLLALEALPEHPKVKGLLLLNPPFRPWVRWEMAKRFCRFTKGKVDETNPHEVACRGSIGVELSLKAGVYGSWLPRFWELLVLCRRARKGVHPIPVPCKVFLGRQDELVSLRSEKYVRRLIPAELRISEEAGHFYYTEEDKSHIETALRSLLSL